MKTETYILPAYWASALINADLSGMEDSDIEEMNRFIDRNKEENCIFWCIECSEESYFTSHNDAGTLAGDVLEYTFDISPVATN